MTPAPVGQGVIVSQERGAILAQLHIDFQKIGAHLPSSFQSRPGVLWCQILATAMGFDKNACRSRSEQFHALFLARHAGLTLPVSGGPQVQSHAWEQSLCSGLSAPLGGVVNDRFHCLVSPGLSTARVLRNGSLSSRNSSRYECA